MSNLSTVIKLGSIVSKAGTICIYTQASEPVKLFPLLIFAQACKCVYTRFDPKMMADLLPMMPLVQQLILG